MAEYIVTFLDVYPGNPDKNGNTTKRKNLKLNDIDKVTIEEGFVMFWHGEEMRAMFNKNNLIRAKKHKEGDEDD